MQENHDTESWIERPYIEFLCEVDRLLEKEYGITTDDTGMTILAAAQEAGEAPRQVVDWYAAHYQLQPLTVQETP